VAHSTPTNQKPSSTHPLGVQRQGSGRGGGHRRCQAATAPRRGGNKDISGNSNGERWQQSTINNQLKAVVAAVMKTATTATTMNENKGNGSGGGSLAAAWRGRRWQCRVSGGNSTAAANAVQRWWWWQLSGGGGSMVVVAARRRRRR
jgi:hypothetical protein